MKKARTFFLQVGALQEADLHRVDLKNKCNGVGKKSLLL